MKKKYSSACCSVSRSESQTALTGSIKIPKLKVNKTKFTEKMIFISGGEFLMGSNDEESIVSDGEGIIRKVRVDSFYIDSTVVTNEEFNQFVVETGYVTEAEKFEWSFVFYLFISKKQLPNAKQIPQVPWWLALKGANWYQPEGIGSSIKGRMNHPVTHISWNDAMAFCEWAGKRLPTEAEWEYAARGGLVQQKYPWGNELSPGGKHYCNIWQGNFPKKNNKEDGYLGTAPARSFPANRFGLYNVAGNVWEWCSDWFTSKLSLKELDNPKGPIHGIRKVMKGGSYLCHESYCNRYRVAARSSNTIDSSSGNLGFRCVADI